MRRSAGIAAVLIFGLALAGCGGGSESPDETPEAPEEATTDETPEADGGNLTIWVDETRATALASTVEQFEEDTGGDSRTSRQKLRRYSARFLGASTHR